MTGTGPAALTVSSRTEPGTGRPPGTGTLTMNDAGPALRAHKESRRTAGQPAARNSPSCASSASRSAAATIWCTREDESLTAAASVRMDTPSACRRQRPAALPFGLLQPGSGDYRAGDSGSDQVSPEGATGTPAQLRERPPAAQRGRRPGPESRRGLPGTGRAPRKTGAAERTLASSRHAARTTAPAHHRPGSRSRSAHHHPAHASRDVRLSRKYGGHHPPQTPMNPGQYWPRTISHVPAFAKDHQPARTGHS